MRKYLDSIIEDSSDNRIALVSRSPGEVRDGREGCPEAAHRANAHMRAGKNSGATHGARTPVWKPQGHTKTQSWAGGTVTL